MHAGVWELQISYEKKTFDIRDERHINYLVRPEKSYK